MPHPGQPRLEKHAVPIGFPQVQEALLGQPTLIGPEIKFNGKSLQPSEGIGPDKQRIPHPVELDSRPIGTRDYSGSATHVEFVVAQLL